VLCITSSCFCFNKLLIPVSFFPGLFFELFSLIFVLFHSVQWRSFYILRLMAHSQETCTETCARLTQVHPSSCTGNFHNKQPTNQISQLWSRAGKFLARNTTSFYSVQETCTRKKLVQETATDASLLCKSIVQDSRTSFFTALGKKMLGHGE